MKRETAIVSTASNLVSSSVTVAIGIGTGIIVTRTLGPELKGEYANFRLILTLYVPLLVFGYSGGVLYYGLRTMIDLKRFFWSGFLLIFGLGIALTPLLYLLVSHGWLGRVAGQSDTFAILLTLSAAPIILLNAYCERILRSFHLFRATNIRTIIGAVTTLLYLLLVLLFHRIDLQQAVMGVIVGQVTQLLMNLWFIVKYVRVRWMLQRSDLFTPWRYGFKAWFNQIVAKSNSRFDQVVLAFLLPAGPFGIYSVGVGVSNLLTKLPSSYVNVFFNQIAEREPQEALTLYAKAQRITFVITTIMALGLALVAYPLIYVMYGTEFVAAAWVVVLYAPGLVFQVAARLSIKLYGGMGRPLKNSLVYVTGFLVSLPFYYLLIPRYGISGAAISSSVAYLSAYLFSFYQINREFGLPIREVIGIRRNDWRYVRSQLSKLPLIGQRVPT